MSLVGIIGCGQFAFDTSTSGLLPLGLCLCTWQAETELKLQEPRLATSRARTVTEMHNATSVIGSSV